MAENIELDSLEILFEPLDISKYLGGTSKYSTTHQKRNIFTEIEKGRKNYCDSTGKSELFKISCFNYDSTSDGQIIAKVPYRGFHIFASINSLRGFPHSIKISNGLSTIEFSLNDLPNVCQSMSRAINCIFGDCGCSSCFYLDQDVLI